MSSKEECPNCPGRDDHDAEHCPIKPQGAGVPFDVKQFARLAAKEMEKHDFHGFEPVVLAVVEELLAAPTPEHRPDGVAGLLDEALEHLELHAQEASHPGQYELMARIRAALTAPAQGQQAPNYWRDLAVANRKVADNALAELSALKAQQAGQEPFGYLADDGGAMAAFFRAEDKDQFDAFCAEAEPLNKVVLYTTPQPAPAQGVAGLGNERILEQALADTQDYLTEAYSCVRTLAVALTDSRAIIESQLELIAKRATGRYLDKTPMVRALRAHMARFDDVLSDQAHGIKLASAANDKQSGGAV